MLNRVKSRLAVSIKKILYKSFDSILSESENKVLNEKLSNSEKLREEKQKLEKLRITLAAIKTGKFSPDFEISLLNKIRLKNYPQILFYREIVYGFRKFAFAALFIIASIVIFNFGEHGEIKVLSSEEIKLGEALYSDYIYSVEVLRGEQNGL